MCVHVWVGMPASLWSPCCHSYTKMIVVNRQICRIRRIGQLSHIWRYVSKGRQIARWCLYQTSRLRINHTIAGCKLSEGIAGASDCKANGASWLQAKPAWLPPPSFFDQGLHYIQFLTNLDHVMHIATERLITTDYWQACSRRCVNYAWSVVLRQIAGWMAGWLVCWYGYRRTPYLSNYVKDYCLILLWEWTIGV